MSRRTIPFLAAAAATAIASCGAAPAPATPSAAPAAAAEAAGEPDWAHAMQQIKLDYDRIEQALQRPPFGDLRDVADAAGAAAAWMRLGYGRCEDPAVPEFAEMARAAESWLLEIALEARQAHGHIASETFFAGRQRHCGDCHDAHERVHG